jgi:Na+-transporting NADH:ubiquinone oxidoreductase subunit E
MTGDFWMGPYATSDLFPLFLQSVCIENFILVNFLGMCAYLSCSTRLKTANGMGLAVVCVITVSGILNWLAHRYITGPSALSWLQS